ncbi:ABC transporter ATP-binding protein [Streptomyces olivaceus]|uniref:ABC transporter ATP-binding protein n=1 Tax=Streptomyces olivaceus TaxID=47716 RepID=UPI001CCECDA4|nr:ABC transporter ATP-binding protein [Streptomyces olivaceus]MBZ6282981.1 ABC transporter ATP-binding protein/permease [Streptomyces olivaceus]
MTSAVRDRLRLLALLRAAGPVLLTTLCCQILLAGLVPPATAIALAGLLDRVQEVRAGSLAAAAVPLFLFAGVLLLGHGLEAVRDPLAYAVQTRVDGRHRAGVARLAATSRTIDALERPEVQRLIRLARADPENWTERTPGAGAVAQLAEFGRAVTLLSSSVVLAAYAWWLIPLLVLPALLYQQLNRRDSMRWYRAWRGNSGAALRAGLWYDAIVSPSEGKDIRLFGLGGWALDRSEEHIHTLYDPVFAVARRQLRSQWRQLSVLLLPMTVAFLAVSLAAARGHRSLAVAMAVLSAGAAVYRAFGGEPRDMIGGIASLHAVDRLRALLEPGTRAPGPEGADAVPSAAPVRFEGVGFTYPGTSRRVLDGLDLEIGPGELVAVVGLNGAGKSTLIKLLAGLYEPDRGRITAGGVDIAALGLVAWRRRIAVVFQDFVRYHLSAAENVSLGNAAVPMNPAAVREAARDAGLTEVVDRLPDGWDTPLARTRTGGVDLSGGQWQQVVLARALYAVRTGARLLVLDEPTAHLDVRTEFEVFERLAAHKGDASVVLISHRLSTVRRADRIVLLEGGRVVESGTHERLLAAGGRYAEMFAIQADRFNRGYDDRIEEDELI